MVQKVIALLDIGGSKTLLALLDREGNLINKFTVPTMLPDTGSELFKRINHLLEETLNQVGAQMHSMALGVPGPVDYHQGKLMNTPNLPWKEEVFLQDYLTDFWDVPVLVENDANAAIMGEVKAGAAKGMKNAIYITVSTGIGAGFFLNGNLFRGSRGFTAELGHTKSFGNCRCTCGGKGCLEAETSGNSLARKGREVLKPVHGKEITAAEIFSRAKNMEIPAVSLVEELIDKLGVGLANLVNLLDPEALVMGGGVSAQGDELFQKLQEKIIMHSYNPAAGEVPLLKAALEPESTIWGLYYLLGDSDAKI